MITVRNGEYLGLPVLTDKEYEALAEFNFGGNNTLDPPDVVDLVHAKRPLIRAVLNTDILNAVNSPAASKFSRAESVDYKNGIESGYEFMIGSLTYAYFLRSGAERVDAFIDQVPRHSIILPVRKGFQLKRVRGWLAGECLHEPVGGSGDTSKPIDVRCDAIGYFDQEGKMDKLVQNAIGRQIEDLRTVDDFGINCAEVYVQGFEHGAANCVEMYVQSYEQYRLKKIQVENDLRGQWW